MRVLFAMSVTAICALCAMARTRPSIQSYGGMTLPGAHVFYASAQMDVAADYSFSRESGAHTPVGGFTAIIDTHTHTKEKKNKLF